MWKTFCNPFMAYYICHDLCLYPKSLIPSLGFKECMAFICHHAFWCGMKHRLGVLVSHNGGHCGRVNAPWEMGVSCPKLGIARRYGSFEILLCEICLPLWSTLWHEVWSLDALWRYVLWPGFTAFVLWFQLGGLTYFSSAFWFVTGCKVLLAWVVGLPSGHALPFTGKLCCNELKTRSFFVCGCYDRVWSLSLDECSVWVLMVSIGKWIVVISCKASGDAFIVWGFGLGWRL